MILNKKFFIKTFGCQMNVFDSKIISEILLSNGFLEVINEKKSNILIVNTCSIREKSQKKVIFYIKKFFLDQIFIIAGCSSVLFSEFLLKFKNIKIILGPQNIYSLLKLLKMYYFYKCKQINISLFEKTINYNKNYKLFKKNLYLTIIEGCNKYCSYCIVPYTRGLEVSKSLEFIFKFLNKISSNSFLKLNLIGQNVTSYKSILHVNNKKKLIDFFLLLNYLSEFNFIRFLNYLTSHIRDFNDNLINLYKYNSKLINYLHLPLQSCSNNVLLKMNRNYNIFDYINIFNKIKKIKKLFFFSTDIIIGFLNEKKIDFNKTLIFYEKFLFDKSYIFIYNPRPYTRVYFIKNKISRDLINYNFFKIKIKLKNNVFYINKIFLNKFFFVYIKNFSLEFNNIYWGFFFNNRIVKIFLKFNFINKIIKVKILNKLKNFFWGIVI